jgi:hypothetical protein
MIRLSWRALYRPYGLCVAALLAALTAPIHGQGLPGDLEAALRDNVDKIKFRSFAVSSKGQFKDGTWICGTMSARTSYGEYLDFKFTAQLYSLAARRLGGPRSWVILVGPAAVDASNQYGQHCQQ